MQKYIENHIYLATEAETINLGKQLSKDLNPGEIIFLYGDLGAGKTTLVRGLLQGCGYIGAVKSPTFTIVETYEELSIPVCHFDLYRLGCAEELEYMGIRDYLEKSNICIFEWPENGKGHLPSPDLQLKFAFKKNGENIGREVNIITRDQK